MPVGRERTLFTLLLAFSFLGFFSFGAAWPLLPRWTVDHAGMGSEWVGVAMLAAALGAILGRIPVGVVLKHGDPWRVGAVAALVAGVGGGATMLVESPAWLVLCRFLYGCGSAGTFMAAMTALIRDSEPGRLGSRLSYLSISFYLGEAVGAPACDLLVDHLGFAATWLVVGLSALLACPVALLGRRLSGAAAAPEPPPRAPLALSTLVGSVLHRAALLPAAALFLVMAGWAAFQAYAPLYGRHVGLERSGTLFLVFAVVVLVVRVVGASWFDRLPIPAVVVPGVLANVLAQVLLLVWHAPPALYVAVGLMGLTQALVYTNLLRAVVARVPRSDSAAATSTYTMAFDLSLGVAASILGLAQSYGGYGALFLGSALAGLAGLALTVRFLGGRRRQDERGARWQVSSVP